ncbi:DUF3592 domain-containing protein [Mesorhizobium sp. B2-3-4]|uniref:DUF3592 domain-containing protein n=1 Tax=Mesorhizobium sp. B2-3-4 TaxID=2589959 RepID=UPI001FF0197B|nr:DUF3592 domain-containing protein [Mesorhizobium sp. B2-3-4]
MELKLLLVGFACVVAGVLSLITFAKWREVRAMRHWLPAPGKIISSRAEARKVKMSGVGPETSDATEVRNFPAITFEYKVGGKRFRGSRYSVKENLGNFEVAETLAQFPTGAEVTVFYDPADPGKAVIERTLPDGAFKFMVKLSAGLVIATVIMVFSLGGILETIRPLLPNPENLGVAVFLSIMGVFALLMGIAQKALARQAAKWPVTSGRIDASGLETVRIDSAYQRRRSVFRSRIVYSYEVAGRHYTSARVTFGANVMASLPGLVSGQIGRYAEGSKVDVHYDPANPASAVLEPRARGLWLLWVCALAFLCGAAWLVGLVPSP